MNKLDRTIVLVGLMGAGKTSVGRRLAEILKVPFHDSDDEIVSAAGMAISEIFAKYGEAEFRRGETAVLGRLVSQDGGVLSTGGGAFMSPENRRIVAARGVSVWLDVDLPVLWARVHDKPGRPLLATANPKATLEKLLIERSPVYALADVSVKSTQNDSHDDVAYNIINELRNHDNLNPTRRVFTEK